MKQLVCKGKLYRPVCGSPGKEHKKNKIYSLHTKSRMFYSMKACLYLVTDQVSECSWTERGVCGGAGIGRPHTCNVWDWAAAQDGGHHEAQRERDEHKSQFLSQCRLLASKQSRNPNQPYHRFLCLQKPWGSQSKAKIHRAEGTLAEYMPRSRARRASDKSERAYRAHRPRPGQIQINQEICPNLLWLTVETICVWGAAYTGTRTDACRLGISVVCKRHEQEVQASIEINQESEDCWRIKTESLSVTMMERSNLLLCWAQRRLLLRSWHTFS